MFGVLLGSALLAVILTVMVVGVVRLAAMAARRMRGRTETLTAERCFAEAVAAGDLDQAELQVRLVLESPATPRGRSPEAPPKRVEEPPDGSTLLLPPLWSPLFRHGRCAHGTAGGCRRCRSSGRGRDAV
jgi:hypothetical protein